MRVLTDPMSGIGEGAYLKRPRGGEITLPKWLNSPRQLEWKEQLTAAQEGRHKRGPERPENQAAVTFCIFSAMRDLRRLAAFLCRTLREAA